MKIVLWIIGGLIGLALLVLFGSFVYMKFIYSPGEAEFQLSHSKSFDQEAVGLIEEYGATFENGTVISIGIITPDEEIYFGAERKDYTYKNASLSNSVFAIGSISKVLTGHLLSHFVEDGIVAAEDRVVDLLPLKNKELDDIQLIQLVNHTSNLPRLPDNMSKLNSSDPYASYSDDLLLSYLEGFEKSKDVTDYSNLGFGLLGVILEKKSGMPLNDLYQKYIFEPNGMTSSSARIRDFENRVPPGNGPLGLEGSYWSWQAMAGAGAVASTTSDMLKYVRLLFSAESVLSRIKTPTFVKEKNAIGYGLHIDMSKENKIYWHNGSTGGFRSCMALDDVNKVGVVVLSNLNIMEKANANIDRLCFALLKKFNAKKKLF